MSKQTIGVGIVGLSAKGGWAANAHVPALNSLPDDFKIVGLSASTPDSAAEAAAKFHVPFHTNDPAALAARADVDLVVVAVKVPHHKLLVDAALDAGKSVYCEWPLARDVEEAEGLVRRAKARGRRHFIGLQARSAPPVRFLRDFIAAGQIGTVLSTSVIGSGGPPWGGVCTSASAYATNRETGASMLSIPFGHTIDALSWVFGDFERLVSTMAIRRPVVSLTDTGATVAATVADQIAISGIFASGPVVSMHYRGGMSGGTNFLWEINGTEGDVVVTGGIGHLQFGQVRMVVARGDRKVLSELPLPDHYRLVDGVATLPSYAVSHAYRGVADDLRSGSHVMPTFSDGLRLHRLLSDISGKAGF